MSNSWPSDFFFNRNDFVKRRPSDIIISFPFTSSSPLIHFTKKEDELISLDKSSFGGFITNQNTKREDLTDTVTESINWSRANGITSIIVKLFPDRYHPETSTISNEILVSFGFKVLYNDVAQVIDVTEEPLSLNIHRRRRLKQCIDAGYRFKQLELDRIDEAYPLFVQSREQKGYPLTMSLSDFQESFKKFPNDYLLFGVYDHNAIIATCVCVIVSSDILYTFFIGDNILYRKASPVTQLINGVYEFAKSAYFRMVDLGISTDKGILNPGLHSFKKSLGAHDVYKNTYQLKF